MAPITRSTTARRRQESGRSGWTQDTGEITINPIRRIFRPNSPLKEYLHTNCPELQVNHLLYFTINEVVEKLKETIHRKRNYDLTNPEIVLCDKSLERALNVKALHLAEIRDRVCQQLIPEFHPLANEPVEVHENSEKATFFEPAHRHATARSGILYRPTLVPHNRQVPQARQFRVKPDFLALIRTLASVDINQTVFTYEELSRYLGQYVIKHRLSFFDNRNIKTVIIQGHPLQRVFKVRVFHRTQAMTLLRLQLIPLNYVSPAA